MKIQYKERLAHIWRFLSPFLIVPGFKPWIEDFRRQSEMLYQGDALHRYILYFLAVIAFTVPLLMFWSETGVDDSNPFYNFGYPPVYAMLNIFLILPPVIFYAAFREQILFWLDMRYGHVARIQRRLAKLGQGDIDDGGAQGISDSADDSTDNPAGISQDAEGESGLD